MSGVTQRALGGGRPTWFGRPLLGTPAGRPLLGTPAGRPAARLPSGIIARGMVGWRNPARYLAPLALAATVGITYMIVHHAVVPSHTSTTTSAVQQLTGLHTRAPRSKSKFYVVHQNDTLSRISARTGVSVSVLESLNPKINPNALQPSQRLRLRR